ncbi:hypothetical protein D5045_14515 [Verminephrobacter eiseniae]|uniref:hypothetical protein n=1 Tax=Verminephrobacter eiseniae TaxID=364317 RepID=UPI0022377556|nr:hypothetical protein [Verminephrobacter eiseniae]MCW5261346.1 hypothetical protein [Verminephrobacter eiseniae]
MRHHAERLCSRLDAARAHSAKADIQASLYKWYRRGTGAQRQAGAGGGLPLCDRTGGLFGWWDMGGGQVDAEALPQRMPGAGHLMAPGALMRIHCASAAFWRIFGRLRGRPAFFNPAAP